MQPIPAPALGVVQATLALGVLVELLDGPAAVRQFHQPVQRRVHRQIAVMPLDIARFAWHRALAEQPALRAGADAMISGGELRSTRAPVHRHGDKLFAEHGARVREPAGLATTFWAAPAHVGDLPGVTAPQEGGVVAVARISDHTGKWDGPRAGLTHQCQREVQLGVEGNLCGNMDLGPAWAIGGPALRQIELGSQGPMHGSTTRRCIGDVVGRDHNLAIGDLAQGAKILAGRSNRAASLLGRPGSSSPRRPLDGLCATRARPRRSSKEVAPVNRGCSRSVEVSATATAMVSRFLRGRSVHKPVI
jgi:hypothetical protein